MIKETKIIDKVLEENLCVVCLKSLKEGDKNHICFRCIDVEE